MLNLNIIDATAELKLLRFLDEYTSPFTLIGTYRLIDDGIRPEATVTLRAGDQEMHEADLGVGPVDALANVLKKSLGQLFHDIDRVRLLDFKVRLIEGNIGTSSQIEVDIIFSDGKSLWKVSSVDDNVNLASFQALLDGYEYAIYLWSKGESKIQDPKSKGKPKTSSSKAKKKPAAKPGAAAKTGSKTGTPARLKAQSASRSKAKPKK